MALSVDNIARGTNGATGVVNARAYGVKPSASDAVNAAGLNQAIADVAESGVVLLGDGNYDIDSTILFDGDYTRLVGQGRRITYLTFTPTTGTAVRFKRASSASPHYFCGLEGLTVRASDATATKTAIEVEDAAEFIGRDFQVTAWSGGDSVGVLYKGRQHTSLSNMQIAATIPIRISQLPNTSPVGWLSADFLRVEQAELIAGTPASLTNAVILVDTGTQISNVLFDTVSLIAGTQGFYWNGTTAPTAKNSQALSFRNIRREQVVGSSGYAFYIVQPTAQKLYSLSIADFQGEVSGGSGGIYVRGVDNVALRDFNQYGGAVTVVNADDVNVLEWAGVFMASNGVVTLGSTMQLATAAQHRNGYPYPTHAVYTTQSSFLNVRRPQLRIGDGGNVQTITGSLADDATIIVALNADVQSVVSCHLRVLMTSAAGGSIAEYGEFLLTPATAGTNGVLKLPGSTTNVDVADTDTMLCVYCSGAALTGNVTVKNRLGGTVNYQVWADYTRSTNG